MSKANKASQADIDIGDFEDEAKRLAESGDTQSGIFVVKTANEWLEKAKTLPIPCKLFGELWYEGELCILFADTNLGKSILAMQIADAVSRGVSIFDFSLEAKKQPVVYLDFELTCKQFQGRYSKNYEREYKFDNNFFRAELDLCIDMPEHIDFSDFLIAEIEKLMLDKKAKILIIDNITYLNDRVEKAKEAAPLMKKLNALKKKHNFSMLVISHTPKRDLSKIITQNDIQGSKMIANFIDSSFAIGRSIKDGDFRYIKQIKIRNGENKYGTENVIICQITKPDNFLHFEKVSNGSEYDHLKQRSKKDKQDLKENIIALNESEENLSLQDIADRLGTYKMNVKRVLDKHKENES